MPDQRHEHGSGVVPMEDYQPGSRMVGPEGRSRGVAVVPAEHYPMPTGRTRRQTMKAEQEAVAAQQPKRRGRPVGSKNRPPPTQEMFDGPPDVA